MLSEHESRNEKCEIKMKRDTGVDAQGMELNKEVIGK